MLKNIKQVEVDTADSSGRTKTVSRVEGTCACGRRIVVEYDDGDGFDCECGRIYNLSGQELRPRAQWEEPMEDY